MSADLATHPLSKVFNLFHVSYRCFTGAAIQMTALDTGFK